MDSTWQRYLDLASGLGQATQRGAEQVVKVLVKQGEVAADRAERAVDDLLGRSEANRKALIELIRSETEQAIARLSLVRRPELERLQKRVRELEARAGMEATPEAPPPKRSARKSPAERRAAAAKRASATVGDDDAATATGAAPASRKPSRPRAKKGSGGAVAKKGSGGAVAKKAARPGADPVPTS